MELTSDVREVLDAAIRLMDEMTPAQVESYFGSRSKTFRLVCAHMRVIGQKLEKRIRIR